MIWAIGVNMVVLAGLQWVARSACLALGAVIVAAHNLLDLVWPPKSIDGSPMAYLVAHSQMAIHAGPFLFLFVYPVLP